MGRSDCLISGLSDLPDDERQGVKTRLENLISKVDSELNVENSLALMVRYYWDTMVAKILKGDFYYPPYLEIDLSTFCSSNCFWCKEGNEKKRKEYPLAKLESDLSEFSQIDETSMVVFAGGGDPIDSYNFEKAVKMAKQYAYKIYISTHGGKIGLSNLPIELFTDSIDVLKISISSPDPNQYNLIQHKAARIQSGGPMSVDYVFEQIHKISSKKRVEKIGDQLINLPIIMIGMTINANNQQMVTEMARRAYESGTDILLIRPVISPEVGEKDIEIGMAQAIEAKNKYKNSAMEVLTFSHKIEHVLNKEDKFSRCMATPVISPDTVVLGDQGSITPCIFRRGNRLGNEWLCGGEPVRDSILEILNSQRYKKTVTDQDKNLYMGDKKCPGCRRVINNILLDILSQANESEREVIKNAILLRYPDTPRASIMRGFI